MTALLLLLLAGAPKGAPDGGTKVTVPSAEEALKAVEQRAIDQEWDKLMDRLDAGMLGPSHPPFVWHISNIISSIDVPGIVMANGFPVKMHALKVKGTEEEVFREIGEQFTSQGLYVKPMAQQSQILQQWQLTGLDGDRGISYTAFVEPHKDGTCTVVLGEANISEGLQIRKRGDGSDFAPVYPKAQGVTRSSTEGYQTLVFRTLDPEADVLAFYEKELKLRGYAPQGHNIYRKTGEELKLVARRIDGTLTVILTRSSGGLAPTP